MQISAILDPLSRTAREWRSRRLMHGLYFGVRFYQRGSDYVAVDLDPDTVARLEGVGFVTLEIKSIEPAPVLFSDDELFGPAVKKSKK